MEKTEQARVFRSTQVLTVLFSIIFFFVIAYGYFSLFLKFGVFIALVAALLLATFAWYLARVIGTSPGGLGKNWILLFPLIIVSSAGVYNSLMFYLEGGQIVADTVSDAQTRFANLQRAAQLTLAQPGGVNDHLARVKTVSDALFSEIRNPLNCGQGPEARKRIAELKEELPGFVELSDPRGGCDNNEDAIADYTKKIAGLVAVAPWNNLDVQSVVTESLAARSRLDALRASYTQNYNPFLIKQAVTELESLDSTYGNLRLKLSQYADVKDLYPNLNITAVQSLGNVFKLPSLFIERLDRLTTYVYLLIAITFDLLMIYLFERVTRTTTGRRPVTPLAFKGAL